MHMMLICIQTCSSSKLFEAWFSSMHFWRAFNMSAVSKHMCIYMMWVLHVKYSVYILYIYIYVIMAFCDRVFAYIYIYICVYIYVCVCICMYVLCIYAYVCVCACICALGHTVVQKLPWAQRSVPPSREAISFSEGSRICCIRVHWMMLRILSILRPWRMAGSEGKNKGNHIWNQCIAFAEKSGQDLEFPWFSRVFLRWWSLVSSECFIDI